MPRIQVVYASRHGGTAGIAERICRTLEHEGLDVNLEDAAGSFSVEGFDGHVIGSGVYIGRWLDDGIDFLERNAEVLASQPVWLFSSGPVGNVSPAEEGADQLEQALGPAEGPGSAGRKRIAGLSELIHPRDHKVFAGVFDPTDPPKSMQERIVRMLPAAKSTLPAADFRDWVEIEDWARRIAAELVAMSPALATR